MTALARTLWLLVLGASLALAPAPVVAGFVEAEPAERVACDAVPESAPVRAPAARVERPTAVASPAAPAPAPAGPNSSPVRLHVLLCVWRE
jgi:hypothetical protein